MPQRLGIVDLGSNTARLVVFVFEPGRWFRIEDQIREPVRLAEGFASTGRLSDEAIERSVSALHLFADYASATGLGTLQVVGTSALRDASNRHQLLDRIAALDLELRVLSGEEEARFGVRSVANSLAVEEGWVMDLGGGSVQISRMESRDFVHGASYPLGMVRLTERFLPDSRPRKRQVAELEAWVAEQLKSVLKKAKKKPGPWIAMGGTVRNLARWAQKRDNYPLSLLHHYPLKAKDLEEITERLLDSSETQRRSIPGIRADRGDVILAGALVYRHIARKLDLDHFLISGQGMREGAFYQYFFPPPHRVHDVRRFHRKNRRRQYPTIPEHNKWVGYLAQQLFDQLQPLHGLGGDELDLLLAAAEFHDAGVAVDFYHHHRHGRYLLGARPLYGWDHREQALIMQLVRYHEKGTPKLSPFEAVFRKGDLDLLRKLAACLRLSELLERSRAQRVRALRAQIQQQEVTLELEAETEPVVEIQESKKMAAELFEQAFERRLRFRVVPPSTDSPETGAEAPLDTGDS
ncbi:MAG: Ppx/GppA phosphatase family protein [Acidobacteriota bacterium]